MPIVHIHIERTGGISIQDLYEQKYGGQRMIWYSARDGLFAPFGIKAANYTRDWQLEAYAFVAKHLPYVRQRMLQRRTRLRREQAILELELTSKADVVIGHFSIDQIIDFLPPADNEYRTVVRDPLERMWSHFNHWHAHGGDVGQRIVPKYDPELSFEDYALLPALHNYQTTAVGIDRTIFKRIGITENLTGFAKSTGLLDSGSEVPSVNHFGKTRPEVSSTFLKKFKAAHAEDYNLYSFAKDNEKSY